MDLKKILSGLYEDAKSSPLNKDEQIAIAAEYINTHIVQPKVDEVTATLKAQNFKNLNAAYHVCKIYFEIAADAIGEDAVRQKREDRLAKLSAEGVSPDIINSSNFNM